MIRDYSRMAWDGMRHRGLRTWLTMIGIFVGIAAVVALISLAQGFQDYLDDEFKELGADKILITPQGSSFGVSDAVPAPLMLDDYEHVRTARGVDDASYYFAKSTQAEWGDDDFTFPLVLSYPLDTGDLITETFDLHPHDGRLLKEGDKYEVYVGWDYQNFQGFSENIESGDKITVKGKEFRIIGVNNKIGNEGDDRAIYMPVEAFEEIFGDQEEISGMIARVTPGFLPSEVVGYIEQDLRKHRHVDEGEEDFEVQTFEELIQSFLTIFNIVQAVLVGIAAISLLVGAVGIMNTMYTSVIERTREIGIMKAIGARNSDILKLFVVESGFLGLIGGAIGVVLGLGISKGVEFIGANMLGTPLLKAAVPLWLVVGALAFAFVLGSVSGFFPAKQAASLNPVDALRSE